MSGSTEAALWVAGRATGVVSLVLLTVVMVLGIGSRSGRPAFGLPRFAVVALHRSASMLAVAFLVIHVVTLLLDPQAELRLVDLLLPFDAAYRPVWMGLGTLGLDLMAAIFVTSLLRQRIGVRVWRAVHWLAYASWPVAIMHTIGTGTDGTTWWLLTLTGLCVGAVAAAVFWRLGEDFGRPRPNLASAPGKSRGSLGADTDTRPKAAVR
jgi:sulfoxide reductase heme-binding subunit YedZ